MLVHFLEIKFEMTVDLYAWHNAQQIFSVLILYHIYPNASGYENALFSRTLFHVSNSALFLHSRRGLNTFYLLFADVTWCILP